MNIEFHPSVSQYFCYGCYRHPYSCYKGKRRHGSHFINMIFQCHRRVLYRHTSVYNWTTTFLQNDLKISEKDSLFALSCYLGGLTLTRLLLGKLLKKMSSFKIMIASLLITTAGILFLVYAESYLSALISLIVIGVGVAASFPVILGYIGQIYANLSGTAFSIAFVIALSGNTLANYLFGIISNAYGTRQLPVCLLSIIGCLFVLILLIKQNISSKIKM